MSGASGMTSGIERRRFPRLAISVEVDLTSGDNFFAGRAKDLSVGGLFLECDAGLLLGADVTVRLSLLDETFQIPCEVIWTLSGDDGQISGIGVRFLSLTARERRCIETFMQKRSPISFEPLEEGHGRLPPPLPVG